MTKSRGILPPRRPWTDAEDAVLRSSFADHRTKDVAGWIGRPYTAVARRAAKLGLRKSATFLASADSGRMRHGDDRGAATRYRKGCVPMNKGLHRPGYSVGRGRMQETQFKKGQPTKWHPVGSTRLVDGYTYRKTSDLRNVPWTRNWRAEHLVIWEAANGPLPPSSAIAFRNGDRRDTRIENLELITREELMRRNTVHNLPAPLPQTIQLLGALRRRINRRIREEQDRRSA